MDYSMITGVTAIDGLGNTRQINKSEVTGKTDSIFDSILNSAISNIDTTNSLLSDAENAEISFALGETDNAHDLMIALNKASTALQYTVSIRDRLLDAYKEIMQMQI